MGFVQISQNVLWSFTIKKYMKISERAGKDIADKLTNIDEDLLNVIFKMYTRRQSLHYIITHRICNYIKANKG